MLRYGYVMALGLDGVGRGKWLAHSSDATLRLRHGFGSGVGGVGKL